MKYRSDIDGLRAIAVLSVVFFHAGFPIFSGGFSGVDIFFVISGYLISSIILKDISADRFSIARFYERRIRRIIPALTAVIAAIVVTSLFIYPPSILEQFGERLTYAALFSANIEFYKIFNYFGPRAQSVEILHFWSLAVEEQFYVFFPFFLVLLCKLPRKGIRLLCLLIVAALSFAASLAIQNRYPTANFYLLPFRGWEFVFGTVLALGVVRKPSTIIAEAASLAGIGCLAIAMVALDRSTPFPGPATILPCMGAALIIYAGSSEKQTLIYRALSTRLAIFFGLISYSLYLWHWPILVMTAYYLDRPLTTPETLAAIGLSILMAFLSWRFVERPFRTPVRLDKTLRPVLLSGAATLIILAGVGYTLVATHGLPSRVSHQAALADAASHDAPRVVTCINPDQMKDKCGPEYHVFVWGDSHAEHLVPAIKQLAGTEKVGRYGENGCPPLLGVIPVGTPAPGENVSAPTENDQGKECQRLNNATIQALQSRPDVRLVVLGGAWQFFTNGYELGTGHGRFLERRDGQALSAATSRELLRASLLRTADAIRKMGIPVLIVGDVPIYAKFPGECLAKAEMYGRDRSRCRRSASDVRSDLAASNQIVASVANTVGAAYFLPSRILCSQKECLLKRQGHFIYRDADHITAAGARTMAPSISAAADAYLKAEM